MSKIIDFEKKRREKLSSFDHFSKGQKYLRGERIRKENNLSHRENEAVKKDLAKTSKEEMLIELYIVETISEPTLKFLLRPECHFKGKMLSHQFAGE